MPTSHPAVVPEIIDRLLSLQPKRILDVGCGFGKVGFLAREYLEVWQGRVDRSQWQVMVDGIEVYAPNVQKHHRALYDTVFVGDALQLLPVAGHYDLIFCLDMIEHLSRQDGQKLIRLMREHGDRIVVSTPTEFGEQGAIGGNEHERHLTHWTAEDIGGRSKQVGPLTVCELGGDDRARFRIATEGAPGWALRPMADDFGCFVTENVLCYDWAKTSDIEALRLLLLSDPTARVYVSSAPGSELWARDWGIAREQMGFVFHSVEDIEDFKVSFYEHRQSTVAERTAWAKSPDPSPDDALVSACGGYAGVGYISEEQGALLEGKGLRNAVHLPQYVDTEVFAPRAREAREGSLRVGAAVGLQNHLYNKNPELLAEIIAYVNKHPDMEFDERAIVCPGRPGLPYGAMSLYYQDIDLLVCTSRREGGPLSPLQAGASGVPTVSTRCGHMPEFVGNAEGVVGWLAEPTLDDFVTVLDKAAADRDYLRRVSAAVRQHVVANWSTNANCPKWRSWMGGL